MIKQGLVHIYTGDGKGKTTSAVGLATRALGSNYKVCYVSFHKRPEVYGYAEMESLRKLGALILNRSKGHPMLDRSVSRESMLQEVPAALDEIAELIRTESFDLLILDEILISVRDSFVPESRLIEFIKDKPQELELVLTGRGATEAVKELADYVSYITKEKHPFDQGIPSRKGIEY